MKCRHCDVEFRRPVEVPIPHDRCARCHEEIEALNGGKKQDAVKPMMKTKTIITAALMGVSGFLWWYYGFR